MSFQSASPLSDLPQSRRWQSQKPKRKSPGRWWLAVSVLLVVSLACSFPRISGQPTPTGTPTSRALARNTQPPPPTPTPTPQPLPPALVESNPFTNSEVALDGSITLYFNQPMDRETVEASFAGIEGSFTWVDDSTVIFTPIEALEPATQINVELDTMIKATNGLSLLEPVSLVYDAVGFLRLAQRLPEPEADSIDPTSAIVAAFNRPIVPLGGDPGSLPAAFSLSPEVIGRGEWLNTSTYIFYPEPALAGGVEYTVRIQPDLVGADGSPLEKVETWSFATALPRLITIEPNDEADDVDLDAEVVLTFNQPMDEQSVSQNLQWLSEDGEQVSGALSWNEDNTVGTYTPANLLKRERVYSLILDENALSGGGTPLGSTWRSTFQTVPQLEVTGSEPSQGGSINTYSGVSVFFNAPVKSKDLLQFITFEPEVANLDYYLEDNGKTLRLYGTFQPETAYTLILSPNLSDEWNGRLGEEFSLDFETAPLDPSLFVTTGTEVLFLTPQESALNVQVTNISELSITLGAIPLEDFQAMVAPGGYELRQTYQPTNPNNFILPLDIPANKSTVVEVPLSLGGEPLTPGLYYLRFNPGILKFPSTYLLVVSNINMLYKFSATDVLTWSIDLRDGRPVSGTPLVVYTENGDVLTSGEANQEGVFRSEIPVLPGYYWISYVVAGEPGQEDFSVTVSNWMQGMDGGSFGYAQDYRAPHLETYLYTDRPIYRPGQTVFYRAIARQAFNGRYEMPDQSSLLLSLSNNLGEKITNFDLPLSIFGSAHGSYELPADLPPGTYTITSESPNSYNQITFQVAEYRKPEIDLSVTFPSEQAKAGDTLSATINARYFFDAPAGNVPLTWILLRQPVDFFLPGYQVGKQDTRWLSAYPGMFFGDISEQIDQGEGETDPQGKFSLELPTEAADTRYRYTLEVTVTDESGLPVSARSNVEVNPADYFIGVKPDAWVSRVGEESGFEILVVDWDKEPAGERNLRADFQKVVWEREEPKEPYGFPNYVPKYTLVGSTDFATGTDGLARVAFTPPEPGTYQLDVSGLGSDGEGAVTEVLLWVGGPGEAVWPDLSNQRIRLTADKESYQPGDTAQVFIPNPIGESVQALVSVERGTLLRDQLIQVDAMGADLTIPLSAEDAPNVYISVTLLKAVDGGQSDFRQGYLVIPVEPSAQTLQVDLTSDPVKTGPGGEVNFDLRVLDNQGSPVQGEFSLAVVDKAVLALADPNSEEIVPAFYGDQPLGVQTSMGLAASTQRKSNLPVGGGGGGEFIEPITVREEFPDTAYWNAEVLTDENGYAQVMITLPDNLTTWDVDVRGLTEDTLVGQEKGAVISTKDLIVRPVAPRFLVLGDHAMLAAVVQNNTEQDLTTAVTLQASGFALDEPDLAVQEVNVPAGGRSRVEWWGTAQEVESIDPVFSASSGALEDAARPALGVLPVLKFTAPQTFGTSGTLDSGGERLELVSLPRSFDPQAGELRVELAPTLGAAMISGLDVLEEYPYTCTEQTVSRFLPNLQTLRVLQEFGLEDPNLQARLDRTLDDSLDKLLASQNEDGGWGWWLSDESDTYVTAYVLYGLVQAQEGGVSIDEQAVQQAVDYLLATLPTTGMLKENWQFDRLAFEQFVLSEAGSGDLGGASNLFEERARLNPWAQAYLAMTLETLSPEDERLGTLYSDLETSAVRSATGAHWENDFPSWQNMSTTIQSTAVVLTALAQHDPAAPLVSDALRYLMANRTALGAWASTFETAWSLMALAEVMQSTGELSGDFSFSASLNNAPLANGQASGTSQLTAVTASTPIDDLYPEDPNSLLISRQSGPGKLYYTAHLLVNRPVEDVTPLSQGVSITRSYFPSGEACPQGDCEPIRNAQAGELVTAHLTLTIPDTMYYLVIEDYIPAGTEVLDASLKTSQQGTEPKFDPAQPFDEGWGWWYFGDPQIYDDHIAWATDSLPPGTYELTYQLVILQPGEYRVLPARAWQFYFPEVQGTSAGEIFEIVE